MLQSIYRIVGVLSLWATLAVVAEPPAYGSSSDEFDINSISTYLDDDQSSTGQNNKGVSYSYSNGYHTQNSAPDRYKGASSHFTFGQKSPTVSSVSASSPYSSPAANYNQAYSSITQHNVADYGSSNGANSFGSNFDAYNGHPVGLGSYSNAAYSTYSSSPLVAHGTNTVPYTTSPLKSVASTHGNSLSGLSSAGTFSGATSSATYPTSVVGGTSTHISSPYEGHEGNSFSSHNLPSSSIASRPPYQFEKPGSAGPPHFISSYKGSTSPFNSFEGGFSSKPPRYPTLYKGFSSGPPPHLAGGPPTGPSSHIAASLSHKSPYYSEYKGGPGIYYSSRPPSSFVGYKSPNTYESYPSTPYKYISESPRYPRFPGKYSSSRPGYSATKLSYSSRPPIYATGYKSYGGKSPSSSHPYSGHF